MKNRPGDVRVEDGSGDFVLWTSIEEAEAMVVSRKAVWIKKEGRRPRLRLKSAHRLQDFKSCDPRKSKPFYEEHHGGHPLTVLKRPHADGTLHRWDNELTFEELRSGRTRHKASVVEIRADLRMPVMSEEYFAPEAA